jgi:hypothetical protein
MVLRPGWTFLLFVTAVPAFSQTPASIPKPATNAVPAQAEIIPERTLKFTPVDADSTLAISPVTSLPRCDTEGYLFLDLLDPKDLNKHTVVSLRGKQSQTYLPSAISDLHDLFISDFFPSKSKVGFLVRGTKEPPGSPGPGKSPAGIAWSSYHNYIAEFDRNGSYKESIELPVSYHLSHLAIFPSGEFLVAGYDQLNSTVRLLLLSSSGQISKTIDLPGSRTSAAGDAPNRSIEAARATRNLMGSIVFTPYNEDVLVWRANSSDPVLDVTSGGGVREVPLQPPSGFVFVDMIPSNDRWVGHFRTENTKENSPFTSDTYSYFELRPQDASISSKLLIVGDRDLPQRLACETAGSYITYKLDKDNKVALLRSN